MTSRIVAPRLSWILSFVRPVGLSYNGRSWSRCLAGLFSGRLIPHKPKRQGSPGLMKEVTLACRTRTYAERVDKFGQPGTGEIEGYRESTVSVIVQQSFGQSCIPDSTKWP